MLSKFYIIIFLSVSLYAQSYYEIVNYENIFKQENEQKNVDYILEDAFKDSNFKKAIDLLSKKIAFVKNKKVPNLPDFKSVFKYLKRSDSEYAQWLGLTLFTQRPTLNSDMLKKYGIPFAERMIQKNYCAGYIMMGHFLKKINNKNNKILKIWKKGIDSKCHGQKRTKFYLKLRYYGELYGKK